MTLRWRTTMRSGTTRSGTTSSGTTRSGNRPRPVTALAAVFASAALAASAVLAPTASAAPAFDTGAAVPSANDFGCRPSPEHPRPVILVHGTWQNAPDTWSDLAPQLTAAGYCVFAPTYGQRSAFEPDNILNMVGGADIRESATELARFVDSVRAATGAQQVDIVGHSQGGLLARQYLKFDGGADLLDPSRNKVHTLVTLGATNHGTTYDEKQLIGKVAELFGVPVVAVASATVGPSAVQQMVGSPFLAVLNAGGDTMPGVDYTVVASKNDTVSTPPENTFLTADAGAVVDNEWVQQLCPDSTADHTQLTTSPAPLALVMRGLDPSYAIDTESVCTAESAPKPVK